jgi:hypothetical protein
VTADTSRVVVVRAWRDSQRIIIRVLAGAGHTESADEWVFADIDAACGQVARVLCELLTEQTHLTESDSDKTLIRNVDAHTHQRRGQ